MMLSTKYRNALIAMLFITAWLFWYMAMNNYFEPVTKWNTDIVSSEEALEKARKIKAEEAMDEYKKESTKKWSESIKKDGLSPEYPVYKLQQINSAVWTWAFVGHFDKPELIDKDKVSILSVKSLRGKETVYYVNAIMTVKNFLEPYMSYDFEQGKIKIYTIWSDWQKRVLTSKEWQYLWVDATYSKFDSVITIWINYSAKEDLISNLKDVKFIWVESDNASAFHATTQSFDFKIPVKVLSN